MLPHAFLSILQAYQDSSYQDWEKFCRDINELEIGISFRLNQQAPQGLYDLVLAIHENGDGLCSKDFIDGMVRGILSVCGDVSVSTGADNAATIWNLGTSLVS